MPAHLWAAGYGGTVVGLGFYDRIPDWYCDPKHTRWDWRGRADTDRVAQSNFIL